MKKKTFLLKAGVTLALLTGACGIFYKTQTTHHSAPSGAPEAVAATNDGTRDGIRRAIAWLKTRQEADGEFSAGLLDPKPAYTALIVDALARSPERKDVSQQQFWKRAIAAILSHQKDDGGIYTSGLGLDGYCTAISLMALKHSDDPSHKLAIERARAYVASCQVGEGKFQGGFGYSKGAAKADLSNTAVALEALREAGVSKDDPAMKNVQQFLDSCHNDSESNKAAWATSDGGFIYRPGESKAGSFQDEKGQERFRSYGLMSYAGLLSFLTAYVDKTEPRVRSAWRWVQANWDLDNNRNLGEKGLFYYYLTMAKALEAMGERTVVDKDGVSHDWPVELSKAILARQSADGSFQNQDRTWFENDAVLVTAYMVRALSICHDCGASAPAGETAAVGSR